MEKSYWEKSKAKKLFDCFLTLENSSYPAFHQEALKKRTEMVEKFIIEFGANHVQINNYTNMMQFSSAVILDTYIEGGWKQGDIQIHLGSEPQELWARRITPGSIVKAYDFDFENWVWKEVEGKGE